MKLIGLLLISLLLCWSEFVFSQQIVGNVYDYCTSPKRAVQTATGNWVFGLTDRNTPARVVGVYSDTGCLQKIKTLLQDQSNIFIGVDMYAFRSYVLKEELVNARMRGVNVVVTADIGQASSQANFATSHGYLPIVNGLTQQRIPVLLINGNAGGISHNKTLFVIQRVMMGNQTYYRYIYVTGSYNYTDNAETMNRENLVFIMSPPLSIEEINNTYTIITDTGDVETGPRTLLGLYLLAQQATGATALPTAMYELFTEEGYAIQYSNTSPTKLEVTAFPSSAQIQMQNNIDMLMDTAYNETGYGSTTGVPVPGQPVGIGTIDIPQCVDQN